MFSIVNKEFATNTYHWFFLIQPYDFPERVIGADPDYFIRSRFMRERNAEEVFPLEAVEEYVPLLQQPRRHSRRLRGLPRRRQHRPRA